MKQLNVRRGEAARRLRDQEIYPRPRTYIFTSRLSEATNMLYL